MPIYSDLPWRSRPVAEQLFAAAQRWPRRVLYAASSGHLTYAETCNGMLRAAAWLRQVHGIEPSQRVALCLPTGLPAIQAILGVLAAGSAYMPVQFNSPADRRDSIVADFEPDLIITTQAVAADLRRPKSARVAILESADHGLSMALDEIAALPQPIDVESEALAAVYFTSGSTGEPKGVMFSHRCMAGGLIGVTDRAELDADDRMISLASLNYAASVKVFNPFAVGCQSYIASEGEMMFAERVSEIMERQGTTVFHATTSQFRQLVEKGELENRNLSALRSVRLVGERISVPVLRTAMDLLPHTAFQNRYGASEAIGIMAYDVPRPLPADMDELPLGQALDCFEVSLRDEAGHIISPGELGEVCVTGAGAMMGYWKRPDQTAAARVLGDPRSYRTGDFAYLGPDGNYHLVGRRDHQVKIRGNRFELGEIEAALKSHPSVLDAVACLTPDGQGSEVVAAYVRADKSDDLTGALKAICVRRLPVFARPVRIVFMDDFPKLVSGKVDRMALQAEAARAPLSRSTLANPQEVEPA